MERLRRRETEACWEHSDNTNPNPPPRAVRRIQSLVLPTNKVEFLRRKGKGPRESIYTERRTKKQTDMGHAPGTDEEEERPLDGDAEKS